MSSGADTIHFYNGAENSTVGLSPQYWSYTPMLIGDIHRLVLVNGIDCILCDNLTDGNVDLTNSSSGDTEKDDGNRGGHSSHAFRLLPVSRCELCGLIVNLEYRSTGAILFLLDDGTGIVDCISWEKSNHRGVPSLLPSAETSERAFQVGDFVRVLGKIKCLGFASELRDIPILSENLLGETKIQKLHVHECKREIQAVHIEHLNDCNSLKKKNNSSSSNLEVLHWLKCLHFAKRVNNAKKAQSNSVFVHDSENRTSANNTENRKRISKSTETNLVAFANNSDACDDDDDHYSNICLSLEKHIPNGPDILRSLSKNDNIHIGEAHKPLLGHDILRKRLFGGSCKCNLAYKNELLYCHCIATHEQLDPQYHFRDAVVTFLLELEHQLPELNHSNIVANSFGLIGNVPSLKFSYEALLSNRELSKTADEIVSSTSNPKINKKRIYARCLSALRNDGIIYLLDENVDDYVLISNKRVLQPYVKQLISGNGLQKRFDKLRRPNFLANVPQSRLNYAEATVTQHFI